MNERNIKVHTYLKEFYIDSIDYEAENNNQINTDANTEKTKNELIEQEKKFNNFIDAINTSNKIINYIKDNIINNSRELENISSNEDKIINDLDEIDNYLNRRIENNKSKEEILKKNE